MAGHEIHAHSSHTPTDQQLCLSWNNINAFIREQLPSGGGITRERQLLKNVSGLAKPGQMLAIMGASGAGKTTLLNIISGRLDNYRSSPSVSADSPIVEGAVQLNGRNAGCRVDILRRFVAFVEQDDVFPGFLTVEEHLWFHAKLRMTRDGESDSSRRRRTKTLLIELNLTKVADTLIGFSEMGMKTLSGGERKRLSVATELISNPPLLLLDEPTSGLDSFTSESVISALREMALSGKTVAFTIHQPSSELFSYFDRLLLLSEGYVCFHGDAKDAANFFADPPIGRPCPISFNPADFYIDVLSRPSSISLPAADRHSSTSNADNLPGSELESYAKFISTAFRQCRFGTELRSDLKTIERRSKSGSTSVEDFATSGMYSSLVQPTANAMTQLKWSTWRAGKSFYRSPQWMRIRVIEMICFSLFYGIIFFGQTTSPRGIMNRCGLLSQLISLCVWDNLDAYALSIPLDRAFLTRDHSAGLYSLWSYFFGRQFVELPLLFVLTTGQTAIIAAFANLWSLTTVSGAFQMLLAGFLAGLCASSYGYLIGFMSENLGVQLTFRRIVLSLMVLLNGFFLNISTVPPYLVWMVYCSFFFFATEAMFISEWTNAEHLDCTESGTYDPSEGRCFSNGQEVLQNYAYGTATNIKTDFAVLVAMVIILRALALFILYYRSYGSIWIATLKKKLGQSNSDNVQMAFSPRSISATYDN